MLKDEFREVSGRFPNLERMKEPLTEKQYIALRYEKRYTEEEVKCAMLKCDAKEVAENFVSAFHLLCFILMKNRIHQRIQEFEA